MDRHLTGAVSGWLIANICKIASDCGAATPELGHTIRRPRGNKQIQSNSKSSAPADGKAAARVQMISSAVDHLRRRFEDGFAAHQIWRHQDLGAGALRAAAHYIE